MQQAPEICPVCGEEVPARALACPECGADHRSGWREDAESYHGLDLPGSEFDYEEFVAQEFGGRPKATRLQAIWWIAALVLLLAFALFYFLAPRPL